MFSDFEALSPATIRTAETNSLSELNGATVAIEAKFFLQKYYDRDGNFYEALLPALGGLPFGLKGFLEQDLATLKENGIQPLIIFDGLKSGKKFAPFEQTKKAAERNRAAWDFYSQSQQPESKISPDELIDSFRNCDWARPETAYRLFQTVLKAAEIPFQVAPYSADAQLAYLYKNGEEYIDAVAGSTGLLLFDVDKVIIDLNLQKKQFMWIRRSNLLDEFATTPDQLVDALLLAGNGPVEPFPLLIGKPDRFVEAIAQVTGTDKSAAVLCKELQMNSALARVDYFDRFCRARMDIQHHVVLTVDGKVESMGEPTDVPFDFQKVIGPRLPDELYYYLSAGALGSRFLTNLTSEIICVTVPADGGDSDEYKKLVQEKLLPIRKSTISLCSLSLARAYQHKPYNFKFWTDETSSVTFKAADTPIDLAAISSWKVPKAVSDSSKVSIKTKDAMPSISFAIESLKDNEFARKTIAEKDSIKILEGDDEATTNSIWRFLQLRQYINDSHQLTPWGKVLSAILGSFDAPCSTELEQASILATELLRMDILHSKPMYTKYSLQVLNGDGLDKGCCLLLSRIGSLGTLQNKEIGYTGTLSRSVLGYNSVITATQETLRDLLEACLATLLLNGDAKRDSIDLTAVGLSLPFLLPLNTALGLAVNNYLDNVTTILDASDFEGEKQRLKETSELSWLPSAIDLAGDLNKAWSMFDAIHAGVKCAAQEGLVPKSTAEQWVKVEKWLEKRR